MLSTANGIDSIVIKFTRNGSRLKGTLKTAPARVPNDLAQCCTQTGDYSFDAVLSK